MNKLENLRNRKVVALSMIAFWVNFFVIVLVHNLTGAASVHINYSISKYVGLSFPSAIAFLIVNSVISFAIWQYVKPHLKNGIQKILLFIIVVMLIGLSLFPIGLFNEIIPEPVIFGRPIISFLHVLTSRTMFVVMAAFSVLTFFLGESQKLYNKKVLITNLVFVIYSAICITTYLFFPSFFWTYDLIFESVYIALFFFIALAF